MRRNGLSYWIIFFSLTTAQVGFSDNPIQDYDGIVQSRVSEKKDGIVKLWDLLNQVRESKNQLDVYGITEIRSEGFETDFDHLEKFAAQLKTLSESLRIHFRARELAPNQGRAAFSRVLIRNDKDAEEMPLSFQPKSELTPASLIVQLRWENRRVRKDVYQYVDQTEFHKFFYAKKLLLDEKKQESKNDSNSLRGVVPDEIPLDKKGREIEEDGVTQYIRLAIRLEEAKKTLTQTGVTRILAAKFKHPELPDFQAFVQQVEAINEALIELKRPNHYFSMDPKFRFNEIEVRVVLIDPERVGKIKAVFSKIGKGKEKEFFPSAKGTIEQEIRVPTDDSSSADGTFTVHIREKFIGRSYITQSKDHVLHHFDQNYAKLCYFKDLKLRSTEITTEEEN